MKYATSAPKVGYLDSGIGGVMAAMGHKANVSHFAAQTCLPIGEKPPFAVISYTAQMVAEGVIGQGNDAVIIACNTASCAKHEACEIVTDFILTEAKEHNIYEGPEKERLMDLAKKIKQAMVPGDAKAHYEVIPSMVHEVVGPTANSAAQKVADAFLKENKNDFHVVVDSTAATASTGLYPTKITETLDTLMASQGFKRDEPDAKNDSVAVQTGIVTDAKLEKYQQTSVGANLFNYSNGEETKTLLVQSRGHPNWVPNIEGNRLNDTDSEGTSIGKKLADAAALASEDVATQDATPESLKTALKKPADLMMMCCTHYPALVAPLKETHGDTTQFLTQDEVVGKMTNKITEETYSLAGKDTSVELSESEKPVISIIKGEEYTTEDNVQDTKAVIKSVHPADERPVSIDALGKERFMQFAKSHQIQHFIGAQQQAITKSSNHSEVAAQHPPGGKTLATVTAGVNQLWSRQGSAVSLQASIKPLPGTAAANVKVLAGDNSFANREAKIELRTAERIDTADKKSLAEVNDTKQKLTDMGMSKTQIREAYIVTGKIARAVTGGETRGLDILAAHQEPAMQMFNSAADIASVIDSNNKLKSGEQKESVALLTGFTVVDSITAEELGGENDGPPGTVIMAKKILDSGTPVTLICDKYGEASLFAAAEAAELVTRNDSFDENQTPPSERKFGSEPHIAVPNLNIKVVDHSRDMSKSDVENRNTDLRSTLQANNTKVLMSIEYPGISKEGKMKSMAGTDVSPFNADLSDVISRPGKTAEHSAAITTIGIGDGGNEIGTGGANPDTSEMRKPNYDPVVNHGDEISAKTETDRMVLGSVSNNAAVALAMCVHTLLESTGNVPTESDTQPQTTIPTNTPTNLAHSYVLIVEDMFKNGMSLDGVLKYNTEHVDGTPLTEKPAGTQQEIKADADTHFERLVALARMAENP